MASSDDEIEEVIDDISLASGEGVSLLKEVDVEVAFEGDVENSDDESTVRTKKKKITAHVHVDRNVDQSEEEDNIESEKASRRNSRRKGAGKSEVIEKSEEEVNRERHTLDISLYVLVMCYLRWRTKFIIFKICNMLHTNTRYVLNCVQEI